MIYVSSIIPHPGGHTPKISMGCLFKTEYIPLQQLDSMGTILFANCCLATNYHNYCPLNLQISFDNTKKPKLFPNNITMCLYGPYTILYKRRPQSLYISFTSLQVFFLKISIYIINYYSQKLHFTALVQPYVFLGRGMLLKAF